jgi:hypothetical protein
MLNDLLDSSSLSQLLRAIRFHAFSKNVQGMQVHRHVPLCPLEPIRVKFFVDFRDYFGRFLIQLIGAHIDTSILPLSIESKIGSKEPENRLKLFTRIGS